MKRSTCLLCNKPLTASKIEALGTELECTRITRWLPYCDDCANNRTNCRIIAPRLGKKSTHKDKEFILTYINNIITDSK